MPGTPEHRPGYHERVRGCLLGGAVGDALGAPVEFDSLARIREVYGPAGLTGPVPMNHQQGLITDDTQMTLFGTEGLIRANVQARQGASHPPSAVYGAHLRWLDTQRLAGPPADADGWLASQPWLYAVRAPGNACMRGLAAPDMGTLGRPANPDSKGCGAVMRSAPFGLAPAGSVPRPFGLAVACAVHTHGHPSGYLAAGALALVTRELTLGTTLHAAVEGALRELAEHHDHDEVTAALRAALDAAAAPPAPERVEELGGGWVAEEALAIAVYCALAHPDPGETRQALLLAINHSGDSDSTGAICGNLLGTWHGELALPPEWVAEVEGGDTIGRLADDFVAEFAHGTDPDAPTGTGPDWGWRYPPG